MPVKSWFFSGKAILLFIIADFSFENSIEKSLACSIIYDRSLGILCMMLIWSSRLTIRLMRALSCCSEWTVVALSARSCLSSLEAGTTSLAVISWLPFKLFLKSLSFRLLPWLLLSCLSLSFSCRSSYVFIFSICLSYNSVSNLYIMPAYSFILL